MYNKKAKEKKKQSVREREDGERENFLQTVFFFTQSPQCNCKNNLFLCTIARMPRIPNVYQRKNHTFI